MYDGIDDVEASSAGKPDRIGTTPLLVAHARC
jgi:hypothetical protein